LTLSAAFGTGGSVVTCANDENQKRVKIKKVRTHLIGFIFGNLINDKPTPNQMLLGVGK
jgi:hypothetical protein